MQQTLAELLDQLVQEYRARLLRDGSTPFLTAQQLCWDTLFVTPDELAVFLTEEPSLLACRGEHIPDPLERENPSVGVIICSSLVLMMTERLLGEAVDLGLLSVNDEQVIQISETELAQSPDYSIQTDYSSSEKARQNLVLREPGRLSQLLDRAEDDYLERLNHETSDAYQLALDVVGQHVVLMPEELLPLILENPLLLGLRGDDGIIEEELFEDTPPAGIIISSHLTMIMLDHLLEVAAQEGALALDSEGQIILPDNDNMPPSIH